MITSSKCTIKKGNWRVPGTYRNVELFSWCSGFKKARWFTPATDGLSPVTTGRPYGLREMPLPSEVDPRRTESLGKTSSTAPAPKKKGKWRVAMGDCSNFSTFSLLMIRISPRFRHDPNDGLFFWLWSTLGAGKWKFGWCGYPIKTGKQSQFETWKTGSDWLKLVLKILWTQDVARCCKSLSCRKWSAGCLCKRLQHHLPVQLLLRPHCWWNPGNLWWFCMYIYIYVSCVCH